MNAARPSRGRLTLREGLTLPAACLLLIVTGLFITLCAGATLAASGAVFVLGRLAMKSGPGWTRCAVA